MTLHSLRLQLLKAREARAAAITRLAEALPDGHALVFLSLNVPGPGKTSPRLDRVFATAHDALARHRIASALREQGRDGLGPWLAVEILGTPDVIKRRCIALEESLPAGRLVDLDVYDRLGRQVDRTSLGLPPRRCLVCPEAAIDCIRTRRHSDEELSSAVAGLLHANDLALLADAFVQGARIELELTPKPGLVDRRDNGSHPDLSFELMERSVALLPKYYAELVRLVNPSRADVANPAEAAVRGPDEAAFHRPLDLAACVAAGRAAEDRMLAEVGANAHRGYIFLSGLVLLAFAESAEPGPPPALSRAIAHVARRLVGLRPDSARGIAYDGMTGVAQGSSLARSNAATTGTHGETARLRHGVGGIIGEAVDGLPSVFRHALPALERAETRFGVTDVARHAAMATLMTVVEDTTTLHRCGAEGLQRLRRDGRRLLETIESGDDYVTLLERLNEKYRATGMTMGGVADCLALTIAMRIACA